MSRGIRIAVNMRPTRADDGAIKFRAALPMGALLEKSLDKNELERAGAALEENYHALVDNLRALLPHVKDGNVLRYWMFGDVIIEFETQTARTLVFVDKLSAHLARDVGYSQTMIDLCRRFRQKFPDAARLDLTLSFDAYHRNGFDLERARHFEQARSSKRPRGRPRKK